MHSVELQQAEAHLAQLVHEAAGGESIVITSAGKPLAMLSAYAIGNLKKSGVLPLLPGDVIGGISRREIYDAGNG